MSVRIFVTWSFACFKAVCIIMNLWINNTNISIVLFLKLKMSDPTEPRIDDPTETKLTDPTQPRVEDPNEGEATLIREHVEPQKTQEHDPQIDHPDKNAMQSKQTPNQVQPDDQEKNKGNPEGEKLGPQSNSEGDVKDQINSAASNANESKLAEELKESNNQKSSDGDKSVHKSKSEDSLKGEVNLADSIIDEQLKPPEEIKKEIPVDFFYSESDMIEFQVPSESPVNENVAHLDQLYGHDSFKNYNALILDRDTIIYSSGISYTIYNHFVNEKQVFYSRDKGGIGSVAVHPSKQYFAVAEKGVWPNIYIYEYPSLKLYRVIRKGTQKSFSCLNFSGDGEMLASVGSNPDYLFTVWDWKQEEMLLKSKAFSQEVYRVNFSQFNEKWITTSGTGHIRFWRIASTFTGMKLKGDIGKFGQFEISDVVSFAEFEDSNVVSASQYGKLLLWEGNLIKSVISIDAETSCHQGSIEFVKMIGDKIVSAGSDGYIRFWNAQQMNTGESDENFNYFMQPEKEIYFKGPNGGPAHLLWIDMDQDLWIVQDAKGVTWKFNITTDQREIILQYNSGKLTDFAIPQLSNNCLVSTGQDGVVRLWDYGSQRQFYNICFPTHSQSTCVEWIPFTKTYHGRLIAVGFSDGIVRFLLLSGKGFKIVKVFKVHSKEITKIKSNREGNIVVVSDTAGSLFLIGIDSLTIGKITPYCLFETGFKINDMSWDRKGQKVLVACQDGRLHEIQIPKEKECDYSESYVHQFQSKSYTIKMMESQKPNREELELEIMLKKTKGIEVDESVLDVEWEPAPILNAVYCDTDCSKVLCSVDGKYLGHYYIIDFNKERPISSMEASKVKTSYLGYIENYDLVMVGLRNGSWEVRNKLKPDCYLKKQCFDQDYGIVRKITLNPENVCLLSASEDGTLCCHKFDFESFKKAARGDQVEDVQISIPGVILGISEATFGDEIDLGKDLGIDITNSQIYALKDEKLKAGEDLKMSEAEKIRAKKLNNIKELQQIFQGVVEANDQQTDSLAKLTAEELLVDPEYTTSFQQRMDEEEEETRKVLAWDEECASLKRQKLQQYFIDQLEYRQFSVKGINSDRIVSSMKVKKLSPYVLKELGHIQDIIREQENLSKIIDKKNKTSSSFAQSKAILDIAKQKDYKRNTKEDNQEVRNKIREAEAEFEKELNLAITTKGDYKLKCDANYVVPENERLNVSRKKKHLFLHYEFLFLQKKEFNVKLEVLRRMKREMIDEVSQINAQLARINAHLGLKEEGFMLEINEELEGLEADISITEQDIQEHIVQKQKEKEASKKGGGGMGMGGGAADSNPDKHKEETRKQDRIIRPQKISEPSQGVIIKPRANAKVRNTELQKEMQQIEKILLESQKQQLTSNYLKKVAKFDEDVEELYSLRQRLENDLTLVEMKILTYAQEFIIFRDMETYDNQLIQQLMTFGSDKEKFESNFMQLTTQITEIEGVLEQLRKKHEDQKKILKEFVYPEDDEMREKILRYYKIRERKRINKLKKQAEHEERQKEQQQREGSDEEESEESESESDEDSEEEFDEDDKPDITIIENDHKNFERVRKICEYDERIEEHSRKRSELEKERNQINNKIKNLDQELDKTEAKLKDYQKKKLLKINQLIVSYPIHFSQIEYIVHVGEKSRLCEDFGQAILFTTEYFDRLSCRIEELVGEKLEIEKKRNVLNKKLNKLNEAVNKASIEIENKRKEYEEKQLLKFGSTFELDKLKELEPSPQVLDTRELYKKEERQATKKIEAIKQELQAGKRQLLEAKKQNTKVITEITELGERQNELKKKLDSTNKQLFKNYDASKKDEFEKQRQNLKDLIKFLSKEIEDLKTEIGLFKRKGGHIYTMVTSNKKNLS